jgi:hypothetical protein
VFQNNGFTTYEGIGRHHDARIVRTPIPRTASAQRVARLLGARGDDVAQALDVHEHQCEQPRVGAAGPDLDTVPVERLPPRRHEVREEMRQQPGIRNDPTGEIVTVSRVDRVGHDLEWPPQIKHDEAEADRAACEANGDASQGEHVGA